MPLYYRMRALQLNGKDLHDPTPLDKDLYDNAWVKWREDFKLYNLKPHQKAHPNNRIRSLHEVYVRNSVGSVPLAKAVVTFGARGTRTIDQMLVMVCRAETSKAHQDYVQQTHLPSEEIQSIRLAARQAKTRFMRGLALASRAPGRPC